MVQNRGQGQGRGNRGPEVGSTVRYRGEDRVDVEGEVTGVDGDDVTIRLADGSEVTASRKGGRPGSWRPLDDEGEDEEGEEEPA